MTFQKLTPNLMVEDVAQNVAYYCDLLGFDFVMGMRDEQPVNEASLDHGKPLDWAMLQRDQVAFMFQQRNSLVDELPALAGCAIGASLTLYIELEGLAGLYESLQGRADIIKPLQTTFYGMREFYLRDCNGYILALAERAVTE